MREPAIRGRRGPARHERPAIDDAALQAARLGDRVVAVARARGANRWVEYLAPLLDRLRDDELTGLRAAAVRARSAYGPKDSIRDVVDADATEPFLDALDRLLRELARRDAVGRD
jgi:hypothetical protein